MGELQYRAVHGEDGEGGMWGRESDSSGELNLAIKNGASICFTPRKKRDGGTNSKR